MKQTTQNEKKVFLDKLYYERGKQSFDFEVCSLLKDSEGNTRSNWKWTNYSKIGFDVNKNTKKFDEINCRQIFPNEIVLDLEERDSFSSILKKLKKEGFYFEAYDSGSRGIHIHLWFNQNISEEEKRRFITIFGGDFMKASSRNQIALENHPHWKTGKIKTLIETNDGINNYDKLKEFLDNYIPEEYEEILKDKELFNKITDIELDKRIVGERETRKVIFLCAHGRLVENSQTASFNLLINSASGSGKDYVTGNTLEILPKEIYIKKTRISPKAFTYWHNSRYEPDWTWNGKVFYCEDISEHVLNDEVVKVMTSEGSSATIVIKNKAIEIDINGKPVFFTTTASANPNPELLRRFVILNLDESEDQNKAIVERQNKNAKLGIKEEYDGKYVKALAFLKRGKYRVPFADLLNKLPTKNIIIRTHNQRFLDCIGASCLFHQYQRKKDAEGYYLAEAQDYEIARMAFMKLSSNKYMISLTRIQQDILKFFEKNKDTKFNASQLSLHVPNNIQTLQKHANILCDYGILKKEIGKDTWGRDIEFFSLAKDYDPSNKLIMPEFKELEEKNVK